MTWPTTSRQSRGYDASWEKKRRFALDRDGHLCQCKHCVAEGRTTIGNEVDHKVSRAKAQTLGWSKDQIEDERNLQAINGACHKRKTIEEAGGTPKPKRKIGLDGWRT